MYQEIVERRVQTRKHKVGGRVPGQCLAEHGRIERQREGDAPGREGSGIACTIVTRHKSVLLTHH